MQPNIVLIPLAMGALAPFGLTLNPGFAAAAMASSSLFVLGNASIDVSLRVPHLPSPGETPPPDGMHPDAERHGELPPPPDGPPPDMPPDDTEPAPPAAPQN